MSRRIFALVAWGIVAFIAVATLAPLEARPHASHDPNVERFAAFAAAGFFLGLGYPRRFLLVVIVTVALAFGLEAMQQFAIDRHGRAQDASIKAIGGLAGLFVAGLLLRLRQSRVSSRGAAPPPHV